MVELDQTWMSVEVLGVACCSAPTNPSDGMTEFNADTCRISAFYDLAKVAVNRLGFSQGHELRPHGATAVAQLGVDYGFTDLDGPQPDCWGAL